MPIAKVMDLNGNNKKGLPRPIFELTTALACSCELVSSLLRSS